MLYLFKVYLDLETDARSHGRAERHGFDQLAFVCFRLGLVDRFHKSSEVLSQLSSRERKTSDSDVDIRRIVVLVARLLSLLERFDGLRNLRGHRFSLRGWHQALRPKDLGDERELRHHLRSCYEDIEVSAWVHLAVLDISDKLFTADEISFGVIGLFLLGRGHHGYLERPASAVRQYDGRANCFIRLLRVDREMHMHFDRLVELSHLVLLDKSDRLVDTILFLHVHQSGCRPVSLSSFHMLVSWYERPSDDRLPQIN